MSTPFTTRADETTVQVYVHGGLDQFRFTADDVVIFGNEPPLPQRPARPHAWASWPGVTTATAGYRVYVDGVLTARTASTNMQLRGLRRSTTYRVGMSAVNAVGESIRSRATYGTTLPASAIPPPMP
jgi:hypothetical protein